MAAVLTASRFGTASPQFGVGFELQVITAVILGGVAFKGGEGTALGVFLGVLLLTVISSGLVSLGVDPFYTQIVQGGLLVVAVAIEQLVEERREHHRPPRGGGGGGGGAGPRPEAAPAGRGGGEERPRRRARRPPGLPRLRPATPIVYQIARETAPAFRSERWQCVVLTRYDDIAAAVKDTARFSNADRFSKLLDQLPAELQELIPALRAHYASGILQCDPPDHGRIRGLVNRAFTPRAVREAVPRIEALVDELLDTAPAPGTSTWWPTWPGRCRRWWSPRCSACPRGSARFGPLGDDLTGLQAAGSAARPAAERAVAAVLGLEDYFRDLYRAATPSRATTCVTALLQAHEGDDRLTENELVNTCVTILVAGHETTAQPDPERGDHLPPAPRRLGRPALGRIEIERAVEELLRFESRSSAAGAGRGRPSSCTASRWKRASCCS